MRRDFLLRLRELLEYAPDTGVFRWRIKPCSRIMVGAVAGSRSHAYIEIGIDGQKYLAHRLAWLYIHRAWPVGQIDHVNGVGTDNRIANLRDVPAVTNCENQRRARSNNHISRALGVYLDRPTGKWRPKIQVAGKQIYGGSFETIEQAHEAYIQLKRRHHAGCTI